MPLLYLPLILISAGPEGILSQWILSIWLKKIGLSILSGILFGWAANRLLKYSQKSDLIDKQSFIAFWIVLSVKTTNSRTSHNNLFSY